MKKTLQLISGAIVKNNPMNMFKAVHVYGDRIQAQDGRITIDAPCPMPGDYTVEAERFTKAVNACDGAPQIKMTDGGKLSLKKGGFRAIIPLLEHGAYPRVEHDACGEEIALPDGGLLAILAKLLPLCAEDGDSRIWTTGINLAFGYAWATDGIIMGRAPLPFDLGDTVLNIPAGALAILVKIGIEPKVLHITESSITFDLGDTWMRAQLLNVPWPDARKHFNGIVHGEPVPDGLLVSVEQVMPFCTDNLQTIEFSAEGISTAKGEHQAQVEGITLPDGRYAGGVLRLALTLATHANFAAFPAGVGFKGDGVEGVFMGMRE